MAASFVLFDGEERWRWIEEAAVVGEAAGVSSSGALRVGLLFASRILTRGLNICKITMSLFDEFQLIRLMLQQGY